MTVGTHDVGAVPEKDRSVRAIALCFALIPTLAGTARGLVFPGFRLSEVVAVALVVLMLVKFHRRMRIGGAVFWALLAYAATIAAICFYHIISSSALGVADFMNYGLGPTIFFSIYVGAYAAGALPGILELTVKYLLTFGAVMGSIGLMQAFGLQFAREIGTALTGNLTIANPIDWKVPRSVGVFNSWHAYAGYGALCLIVAGACIANDVKIFKRPSTMLLATALITGGLLSSLTFGMISFGLIGFSFFVIRSRARTALFSAAAFIFVIVKFSPVSSYFDQRVALQEAATASNSLLPQTISFRINVWLRDYIPLVQENLLIGYGPVRSTDRVFSFFESMYVYLLVVAGLPALITFLVVIFALFLSLRNAQSHFRETGDLIGSSVSAALLVVVPGLLILMFIHPYMNDAGISQALVMLGGLVIGRCAAVAGTSRHRSNSAVPNSRLAPVR
ncbi:hypothetical protein [Rhodococcus sp. ARC_M6]|uniref:hypothetical protein n=1 Tax=Rhodococcus sp. ARC_M6 TaxID=2928852 RepID=UPI001FB4C6AD|nr:hypothetical protein [Rhodococcus sp. ARC_M6]MCJ0902132.1 hypothetical protein [Rhodococcus sp. ARC_M6]